MQHRKNRRETARYSILNNKTKKVYAYQI